MLNFNSSGRLVPNRNIKTTITEFKEIFVDQFESIKREKHFEAYLNYSQKLKMMCGQVELKQWINGSFVTKNARPKDIDFVTFIDFEIVAELKDRLNDFSYPFSENHYGVDAFIVVEYPK